MKKFYSLILAAILSFCCSSWVFADDEHPWAGTYTFMKASEGLDFQDEEAASYGFKFADEFTITIEWIDNRYKITNFLGYDLSSMRNGGIYLSVEDEKYATCPTNRYMINVWEQLPDTTYIDEDGDTITLKNRNIGLILWGQDGSTSTPITFMKQKDGQLKTAGFGLWMEGKDGAHPVCYYDTCVPLNGGDEEKQYDWAGYYKVSCGWNPFLMDDIQWPSEFLMEVGADEYGAYLAQFLGYDVATDNFNAIYVDPSPKLGNEGQITLMPGFNTVATIDGKKYSLRDGESKTNPIKLVYNEKDDNVSIDYFNIYNETDGTESAYYFGGTAVKITAEEAAAIHSISKTVSTNDAIYNVAGQRIAAPKAGQLYIQNGKKYIAK